MTVMRWPLFIAQRFFFLSFFLNKKMLYTYSLLYAAIVFQGQTFVCVLFIMFPAEKQCGIEPERHSSSSTERNMLFKIVISHR